jgi:ubiquitin-protein ligase
MMRRLRNESKKWGEFNSKGDRQISLDLESNTVHIFYLNISNFKNVLFTIKVPGEYPFKAPKVFISTGAHEERHIMQLYKMTRLGQNELEILMPNMKCLCCFTILCNDKWGPMKNILDILKEIEFFLELRDRVRSRVTARVFQRHESGLPAVLWNEIINFI